MKKPTGVLIAAGQSRRFGADKLLYPLPDGTPLAVAAFRNLKPACAEVVAVLRPEQEELAGRLWNEGARILISETCNAGMGHSLASGVQGSADAEGWILALADMPFIRTETIRSLAQALVEGASIAAPAFDGRRGHPVAFSPVWQQHLSALEGDQGARDLLRQHASCIRLVECGDAGIHADVDVLKDMEYVSCVSELAAQAIPVS